MSVLVLLSGGAARGAVQVAPIEHIAANREIAAVAGTSVGAINGAGVASLRFANIRRTWMQIDGTNDFQKLNFPDVWNGFYHLHPRLDDMLLEAGVLDFKIPFHVGVVDPARDRHVLLNLNGLQPRDAIDGIACSSQMPMTHVPTKFQGYVFTDGGVLNPLPTYPRYAKIGVQEIHAVFCVPNKRLPEVPQSKVDKAIPQAFRTLDIQSRDRIAKCHRRLKEWKRKHPEIRIFVYEPESWDAIGDAFDASPETIRSRLAHGVSMVRNRVEL